MMAAAVPAASGVSRAADRALFPLLAALLVAFMTSITAAGVVTGLLVLAAGLRLLDPGLRARDRAPLKWPLLAFGVVTLVSALAAPRPWIALVESKHLVGIAVFLIAVNGFGDGDRIRRALWWLFLATAVASALALVQVWACGTGVPLPGWAGVLLRVKLDACRASWLFRAKAFFSIYMTLAGALLTVLALILATFALGARAGRQRQAITGVLAAVALALTYVRNAWLGLAMAVLILTGLTRRYAILLGLIVAAVLAALVPSPLQRRVVSIVDPTDPSATERMYFWQAGRRMIRDAPLLGLGPGGVKQRYPDYRDPAARRPATGHLHNNLIQIAAERGLLGLSAWLAIWIVFFVKAGRIYASLPAARADDRALVAGSLAAVGGFLVAGLFEYNFGDSEVIGLVWVVMSFPFVVAGAPPMRSAGASGRTANAGRGRSRAASAP